MRQPGRPTLSVPVRAVLAGAVRVGAVRVRAILVWAVSVWAIRVRAIRVGAVRVGAILAGAVMAMGAAGCRPQPPAPVPAPVSAPAAAVEVVDGATLRLGGQLWRLHGLTPPQPGTTCTDGETVYDCAQSAQALLTLLIKGTQVTCHPLLPPTQSPTPARCTADGHDLGWWMRRLGAF